MGGRSLSIEHAPIIAEKIDDWIELVEQGESDKTIAELFGVARSSLWVYAEKHADVKQRLALARVRSSHVLVDDAQEILDTVEPIAEEIRKADLRSKIRLWRAERLNRDVYAASRVETNVSVNVNLMHLQAVKSMVDRPLVTIDSPPSAESPPIDSPLVRVSESVIAGGVVESLETVQSTHLDALRGARTAGLNGPPADSGLTLADLL